ncbi:hypothetical protein BC936DRAFT_146139 [Jimgerdemannia flammicorona]|uniref:Uncharacterized protein n=2 Tax=Jimgerdemannia flammicorona TaxID=994334 RepID=A0A433QL53_9FUNG|nr:hypothetical protein BC936DRAFT_146139 [Jimgerdemannia flammicorona]RUS30494.1 hypothetical protein BC938DRAFT_479310 [Jimgerdemannia flammicorona]
MGRRMTWSKSPTPDSNTVDRWRTTWQMPEYLLDITEFVGLANTTPLAIQSSSPNPTHIAFARRIETCSFSGYKIYPGKGKTFVRIDNRVCFTYYYTNLNPRAAHWLGLLARMHKKGITEEVAKKRSRRTVKHERAVVGASWEAIRAKRTQKPEVRAAARQTAIRESKEKKKDEAAKKRAEKAKTAGAAAKGQKISKQGAKGAQPKVAAKSR